jgi:hypothetical protein
VLKGFTKERGYYQEIRDSSREAREGYIILITLNSQKDIKNAQKGGETPSKRTREAS